jgi:hypothetical protein
MWHYPELAWKPNYGGTKQSRPYQSEGNRLIFSVKAMRDEMWLNGRLCGKK